MITPIENAGISGMNLPDAEKHRNNESDSDIIKFLLKDHAEGG